MKLLRKVPIVAIMICFTSCDMREARLKSFDKDHWIQVALGSPLPTGISKLEGIGDTWQGFWCHFRFRIDSEDLRKHLTANGYKEKDAADFVRYFTIDPRYEKYFSPKWSPDLGANSKVYVRHPSDYQSFVLMNTNSDMVHIWTGGSHSSGPFPTNQTAGQAVPSDGHKPSSRVSSSISTAPTNAH